VKLTVCNGDPTGWTRVNRGNDLLVVDCIAANRISRASSASGEACASLLFGLARQVRHPSARAYGLALTSSKIQGKHIILRFPPSPSYRVASMRRHPSGFTSLYLCLPTLFRCVFHAHATWRQPVHLEQLRSHLSGWCTGGDVKSAVSTVLPIRSGSSCGQASGVEIHFSSPQPPTMEGR
jgi:hypothetical protein